MKAWNELFLYSTNTRLAYNINCEFYFCHYVWCSPVFNPAILDSRDIHFKIPATSSPAEIYRSYSKAMKGDGHSDLLTNNRNGIMRGATQKHKDGLISDADLARISSKIERSSFPEFEPMLYIISYELIKSRIEKVDVELTANPLGIEYRINDLKENEFEIIQPHLI